MLLLEFPLMSPHTTESKPALRFLFLLILTIPALTSHATAAPFSTNVRPTTLLDGPANEGTLAEAIAGAGYGGNYTQSTNALFTAQNSSPIATMVVEFAGYQNNNSLGIYNLNNEEILLFPGSAGPPSAATLSFSGTDVTVNGQTYEDFGTFGFYLENNVNGDFQWFSQDILNSDGGFAHFMGFEESVNGVNNVYFGFEDLAASARGQDYDYNDMVVKVSGIVGASPQGSSSSPIPEPSAAMLFALGSLVLGRGIRSR